MSFVLEIQMRYFGMIFEHCETFLKRISFSAFDLFPDRSFYRPDYCFHPRGPRGKNYFALHCFNVRLLPYHWCIIHRALQPMANPVENWKVWVSRSSLWKTLSQDSRIHNGSRYSNHSFGMIIGSTVVENPPKSCIQYCERSELRLQKLIKNAKNGQFSEFLKTWLAVKQCYQTGHF